MSKEQRHSTSSQRRVSPPSDHWADDIRDLKTHSSDLRSDGQDQGIHPPRWSQRLLRFFLRREFLEEIEGDINEVFEDHLEQHSVKKAKLLYTREVLKALRPTLTKRLINTQKLNQFAMLKHNLTLAIRGFKRYKTSFFINLIGLSTGIAASLIIFLWISDEYKVDGFHENGERLYQVLQNEDGPDGIETDFGSPFILSDAIAEALPEVEYAVTIGNAEMSRSAIFENETTAIKSQARGIFASKDFFNAFSFKLLSGAKNEVLSPENAIVLSEQLAIALFGSVEDALGQPLKANRALYGATYLITGVFEKVPAYSTLQFEYVANHRMALKYEDWLQEWTADGAINYITLNQDVDLEVFNEKFERFITDKPYREESLLKAYSFHQLYLEGEFANGESTGGRIVYVKLMSVAGIFILLLACINFMNLATAQASKRVKEIGIKKVFGVKRQLLVFQLLTESFLISLFSILAAIGLVSVVLPGISEVVGKELSLTLEGNLISYCLIVLLGITLFSGLYPAFYLSKFQSRDLIKGRLKRGLSDLWIRKGLVILQFSVSTLFVSGFLVLYNQVSFIRNVDLGYDRDDLVHFTLGVRDREPFLNELTKIPNVLSATSLFGGSIANLRGGGSGFSWGNPVENEEIQFRRPQVGYSFFETLDIELLEGRTFSTDFQNEEETLMINEAAAKIIGIDNIVGRTIMDGDTEKQVIGIVKNFKIQSLYEPFQPAIIRFTPRGNHFMVKISKENQPETLKSIEKLYDQFKSEYPFNPRFVNDEYDRVYQAEGKIVSLSGYFTIVAILIACLGLFGLATYNTERRIKEVGIRKVLGSGTFSLIRLLSTDFIVLVTISLTIALPISYLLLTNWLNGFSLHYNPELPLYLGVALATVLLALATVGFRTFKAASVNPAECLRNE